MDWPYVHLLINHFPIILTVMGAASALTALAMRRRGLWLYSVASLTLAGLSIYPTFFTGHEADETFDRIHPWYIARGSIHRHEEAAELTLWVVLAMGIIAAYAWWRLARSKERSTPPGWLQALIIISSLLGVGLVTWTSLLGGDIVHESPILEAPQPPAPGSAPVEGAAPPSAPGG